MVYKGNRQGLKTQTIKNHQKPLTTIDPLHTHCDSGPFSHLLQSTSGMVYKGNSQGLKTQTIEKCQKMSKTIKNHQKLSTLYTLNATLDLVPIYSRVL